MNKEQLAGKFDQFKGQIKETWGKLADDDVALFNGKRDQFVGKIKETYGLAKEEAEKQVKAFEEKCGCASNNDSCDSNKVA